MIYFFVMTEYGHYFEDKEEKLGILTLAKIFFIITSAFLSGIWRKEILSEDDKFIIKISFWMYLLGVLIESLGYFFSIYESNRSSFFNICDFILGNSL